MRRVHQSTYSHIPTIILLIDVTDLIVTFNGLLLMAQKASWKISKWQLQLIDPIFVCWENLQTYLIRPIVSVWVFVSSSRLWEKDLPGPIWYRRTKCFKNLVLINSEKKFSKIFFSEASSLKYLYLRYFFGYGLDFDFGRKLK